MASNNEKVKANQSDTAVMQQIENACAEAPHWLDLSVKAEELGRVLLERHEGRVRTLLEGLLADRDIQAYQCYANVVSVRRLGFNDHGPVHKRLTTYNALKVLRLLHQAGIPTSLEKEHVGTYEDSQIAVALGCFLHDLGMAVTRDDHEWHSLLLGDEFIRRHLARVYPDEGDPMRHVLRALCHEMIVGHMANSRIYSIEAGCVLVADGTDMTRGRSRVPMMLARDPMVGDIHRFSANAITRVEIGPGELKPVRIAITMEDHTGIFQVEEVFMTKVKASPLMPLLEVPVFIAGEPPRYYLR
ncbi:MAG: HD domain-containing protein [Candidatus Sumerlaeia bacterium]